MLVHQFVDGNKPIMVFVHGLLTPWQIWMPQIEFFKDRYNIYAIALNAHTEEQPSEFLSVRAEADQIMEYFISQNIDTIDVLCGISLGGKIVCEIWKTGTLKIRNLIMDGAPLVACPKIAVGIMVRNYKNIIRGSKQRDAKVIENFKKYFLLEKYLDSYLKIADHMTDASIENIVTSVFSGGSLAGIPNHSRILFLHGTKGNEILSKKAAKRMKKYYPETQIVCFSGDVHCYNVIYRPKIWLAAVQDFLNA